jgi:pyrroline-5-carboxylate reductase
MSMKIAFLGGGNMANAFLGGLRAKGFAASDISIIEKFPEARAKLVASYGVHASAEADAATAAADTLVLAVKPQDMKAALAPLAAIAKDKLVISIAAGVRIATLSRWLGGHSRIVRCMPNTPALIGAGITGLYAPPGVSEDERARAARILGAVGECVWVPDEALLDPVTAVSGSGPAYVFWFMEQMARAGESMGLAPDAARTLALHTVLGAAKLAAGSDEPPSVLRERVTSKGGTTAAALQVMADEGMAERLARAMRAASARGTELGDQLDRD